MSSGGPAVGTPGGRLVVALRAEPSSLNPVFASDRPSLTVLSCLHGDLVHLDRASQRPVAALARAWEVSEDGRRLRLDLRRDLRFSDGHPMDSGDVLFTLQVLTDEALSSPYRGSLVVGGEPVKGEAPDDHTVELSLAEPYASGELLLDSLAVLPEHLLRAAYEAGSLASAWPVGAEPSALAGAGPFRLRSYRPGERMVLERNPHYWKRDEAGQRLPYLDEIVFLFVPDESAQVLRFQAGETDVLDRLSAASFALLEESRNRDRWTLKDLGPGLAYHFLFFNLNDLGGREGLSAARRQRWFFQQAFRAALSRAADRQALAAVAFQGRATPLASPVSPANKVWHHDGLKARPRDLEEARRLLVDAGFSWRDGALQDDRGEAVKLTLAVNAGNGAQVAMATLLQEDWRGLGLEVQVAPLEFRALLDRIQRTFDYDAALLGLSAGLDPATAMNVWTSSGATHLWRLEGEPLPWEERIDRLMAEQLTALDRERRKALYDEVQEIAAAQLPLVPLVSPNVLAAAKAGLGGFQPVVLEPPTLWNVDELFWRNAGGGEPTEAPVGR